ncbi:MAG: hypothetical protein ACKPKO_36350, partial [Candidatus Fonsibacter sp.]
EKKAKEATFAAEGWGADIRAAGGKERIGKERLLVEGHQQEGEQDPEDLDALGMGGMEKGSQRREWDQQRSVQVVAVAEKSLEQHGPNELAHRQTAAVAQIQRRVRGMLARHAERSVEALATETLPARQLAATSPTREELDRMDEEALLAAR